MSHVNKMMRCEDFYDQYFSDECDRLIQDMFYNGGCNTRALMTAMKRHAKIHNVELNDVDEFKDDEFFHHIYQITEKGLS